MEENQLKTVKKGRFAPSPTGRMHLGNVYTALISWLSAKKGGGKWLLRIEDLDPQRSKTEHALMIEDDLHWLGLDWDEGGTEERGDRGPYSQSHRSGIYASYLDRLRATGLTYPCFCTRADILSTQAPHQSDGRVIYGGRCRPASLPCLIPEPGRTHSTRLFIPDEETVFTDMVYGEQRIHLARECGDFVVQRSDGAWAYQLAVVVDDALMGVTEVVRGNDLLLSAAQQLYLYRLLDLEAPTFAHLPLICNSEGRRLSKRDASLSMAELRKHYSAEYITGYTAFLAGLLPAAMPCRPDELIELFDWNKIQPRDSICINDKFI